MGLKLYPSEVQSCASEISANVSALAEQLENSYSKIEDFEGEKELDGVSWGGTKQQLASHKYVIRGILAAGDMMSEDARRLAADVGDEILDEDVIQDQLYTQQLLKEEVEQSLQYYRYRHGRTLPDGTVLNFGNIISSYTDVLNTCIAWIQTYHEKLERLYAINSSTGSLFQRAIDLFNAVSVVNAAVIGSWNGKEFTAAAPAEAVAVIMGGWENTKTSRELRRAGITMEQIQNMEGLGYTPEKVLQAWEVCQTKEDREFFICLMNGTEEDYIKAFAIDPNDLSEGMTIIMADYACHLLKLDEGRNSTEESEKRLMEFNNAILKSEILTEDSLGNPVLVRRDVYIEKLCIGTQLLMQADLAELAAMQPDEKGYNDLFRKYEEKFVMAQLWAAERDVINNLAKINIGSPDATLCTIQDLSFDNLLDIPNEGGFNSISFSFSLSHHSDYHGEIIAESVRGGILENQGELEEYKDNMELGKLAEANENALRNFLTGMILDGGLLALNAYSPVVGMLTSVAITAGTGGVPDLSGLSAVADSPEMEEVLNAAGSIIESSVSHLQDYVNVVNELNGKSKDTFEEGFGMGAEYRMTSWTEITSGKHISMSGIYDPDVVRTINVWEKEGLAGWMPEEAFSGIGGNDLEKKVKSVMKKIEVDPELSKNVRNNCKKLLLGNENMFQEITMEEFTDAVRAINGYLEEDIRGHFIDLITENSGKGE